MDKKWLYFIPACFVGAVLLLWNLSLFQSESSGLLSLVEKGGHYGPLTFGGEFWRLWSASLVHQNLISLTLAAFALTFVSYWALRELGPVVSGGLLLLGPPIPILAGSIFFPGLILWCPFFPLFLLGSALLVDLVLKGERKLFLGVALILSAATGFLLLQSNWLIWLSFSGVIIGSLMSFLLHGRPLPFQLKAVAGLALAFLCFPFVPKKYNYLPVYRQFSVENRQCREKAKGYWKSNAGQKEAKVLGNSLAMLNALVASSCLKALEKSPQVANLASGHYGLQAWERKISDLQTTTDLLLAEAEILKIKTLRVQIGALKKTRKWNQMIEMLDSASDKPETVNQLLDRLKVASPRFSQKVVQRKIEGLSSALSVYQKLALSSEKLKKMLPGRSKSQSLEKLATVSARFEEKRKVCDDFVESIELSKEYYFADFEKQLENVLKESCRPALFLAQDLVKRSLSPERKRHWENFSFSLRKMQWRIHSTLEIVREKEMGHTVAKLKYESDWKKIARLREQKMKKSQTKIDILLAEYERKFQARATSRDRFIKDKLLGTMKNYQRLQQSLMRRDRVPASEAKQ